MDMSDPFGLVGVRGEFRRVVVPERAKMGFNVSADGIINAVKVVIPSHTEIQLIHIEKGTPAQITQSWDRLAREDDKPS